MGSHPRRYRRVRHRLILRAMTPIAHHETSRGNVSIVMTEMVRQPDGRYAKVAKITGDSLRHGLRKHGAMLFLQAAGLLDEPSLSAAALRLLFAGGSISGPSGATVPLAEYRRLVELVPTMALLGGCADNRMIPGNMQVEPAILLCDEARPLLTAWTTQWLDEQHYVLGAAWHAITLEQRVRMDPTLAGETKALLEPRQLELIDAQLDARAVAQTHDEIKDSKCSMMPRQFEVVAAGSHFQWGLSSNVYSDLEADTLNLMLAAYLSDMQVGGKAGTGHGQLEAVAGSEYQVYRPIDRAGLALPHLPNVGAMFREHVASNAVEIKDLLARVVA